MCFVKEVGKTEDITQQTARVRFKIHHSEQHTISLRSKLAFIAFNVFSMRASREFDTFMF
jgi:hypothetical protein